VTFQVLEAIEYLVILLERSSGSETKKRKRKKETKIPYATENTAKRCNDQDR